MNVYTRFGDDDLCERETLTRGTAEIFGAELPKSTPVELPGGSRVHFTPPAVSCMPPPSLSTPRFKGASHN